MNTAWLERLDRRTVWAVYDQREQTIERVHEDRRDAQAWCDENNSYLGWDRFCVEPVPAEEWADDQIRWAS